MIDVGIVLSIEDDVSFAVAIDGNIIVIAGTS